LDGLILNPGQTIVNKKIYEFSREMHEKPLAQVFVAPSLALWAG